MVSADPSCTQPNKPVVVTLMVTEHTSKRGGSFRNRSLLQPRGSSRRVFFVLLCPRHHIMATHVAGHRANLLKQRIRQARCAASRHRPGPNIGIWRRLRVCNMLVWLLPNVRDRRQPSLCVQSHGSRCTDRIHQVPAALHSTAQHASSCKRNIPIAAAIQGDAEGKVLWSIVTSVSTSASVSPNIPRTRLPSY